MSKLTSFSGLAQKAAIALFALVVCGFGAAPSAAQTKYIVAPGGTSGTTVSSTGVTTSVTDQECKEFEEQMRWAAMSNASRRIASAQEVREQSARDYMGGQRKRVYGSSRDRYCLDNITDFYRILQKLINPINMLIDLILNAFKALLNAICSYVVAVINNVLASVCIPLPNLGLNLPGLGGPERKACNGISLADILYYQSMPVIKNDRFPGSLPDPDQIFPRYPVMRERTKSGSKL